MTANPETISIFGIVDVQRDGGRWPPVAGTVDVDHGVVRAYHLAHAGAFSQRDTVGWEHRSAPLSGRRPQASLKPGSVRHRLADGMPRAGRS